MSTILSKAKTKVLYRGFVISTEINLTSFNDGRKKIARAKILGYQPEIFGETPDGCSSYLREYDVGDKTVYCVPAKTRLNTRLFKELTHPDAPEKDGFDSSWAEFISFVFGIDLREPTPKSTSTLVETVIARAEEEIDSHLENSMSELDLNEIKHALDVSLAEAQGSVKLFGKTYEPSNMIEESKVDTDKTVEKLDFECR